MLTAVHCVNDINSARFENSFSYGRKCVIRCGLFEDPDGIWKLEKLSLDLPHIIEKHPMQFNGLPPMLTNDLE